MDPFLLDVENGHINKIWDILQEMALQLKCKKYYCVASIHFELFKKIVYTWRVKCVFPTHLFIEMYFYDHMNNKRWGGKTSLNGWATLTQPSRYLGLRIIILHYASVFAVKKTKQFLSYVKDEQKIILNGWATLTQPSSHLGLKVRTFFNCPGNTDFENDLILILASIFAEKKLQKWKLRLVR